MNKSNILVTVFLRGGCDGLNLVAPTSDPIYITERKPESRVERDGDNKGLPLNNTFADADFRFHFKAQKLKELYDSKHLAIVHACGLTNGTRSHFEAIDYMERGTPDNKNTSSGWLTRLADSADIGGLPLPVVATSNTLPISLLASNKAVAVPNVRKIQLKVNPHYKLVQETLLKRNYQGNSKIAVNGLHTLGVIDTIANRIPHDNFGKQLDYAPSAGVVYPNEYYANELSNSLKTLAQLIKMDIGVKFATADYGGWDTHIGQGGRFTNLVDGLSRSLAAFWDDMTEYHDRLTIIVMSEFGRRLKSNDSGGTDHGHGNAMMVLGGQVNGGNIYGHWPGLANEHLDNQVDLAITTDYRSVISEIINARFNQANPGKIFPGFSMAKPLGIIS